MGKDQRISESTVAVARAEYVSVFAAAFGALLSRALSVGLPFAYADVADDAMDAADYAIEVLKNRAPALAVKRTAKGRS